MASKFSHHLAKNLVARALGAVVDPHPSASQIAALFEYFGSKCAYCGAEIHLGTKDAHLDHIDSDAAGGSNHISNRVPSCADCNEKEKRERPWLKYLKEKSPVTWKEKANVIKGWVKIAKKQYGSPANAELREHAVREAKKIHEAIDKAVVRLRKLRP